MPLRAHQQNTVWRKRVKSPHNEREKEHPTEPILHGVLEDTGDRLPAPSLSQPSSPVVSLNPHFPQEIKDFCFSHYVLQDRHPASTYRSILESWDQDEWGLPPSRKTVERWIRTEDWNYKADLVVSQTYPGLYQRDVARMVALRGRAIRAYSRILDGEDVRNAMAVAQIARHTLDLTLGGMSVSPPAGEISQGEDLTPEQRAARQRERLDRARSGS